MDAVVAHPYELLLSLMVEHASTKEKKNTKINTTIGAFILSPL